MLYFHGRWTLKSNIEQICPPDITFGDLPGSVSHLRLHFIVSINSKCQNICLINPI